MIILLTACGGSRSKLKLTSDITTVYTYEELQAIYGLALEPEGILDRIKDEESSLASLGPLPNYPDAIALDRQLTESEILKGDELAGEAAEKYNQTLENEEATKYLAYYKKNDQLYVDFCSRSVPYTIVSHDGVERIIQNQAGGIQIINSADNSVYQTGFSSSWKACRYLTSDYVGVKYMEYINSGGDHLNFAAKFKKNGGISGGGRIQTLHGSLVGDYCARNFKATDGLDNSICP